MDLGSLQVILLQLLVGLIHSSNSLAAIENEDGTSIVPERFLPPRHFNHHPYTDVPQGGYSLTRREQERAVQIRGDGFKENPIFNTRPILFSPKPKKYHISRSYDDQDEHVPKKYMFHYVVHDAGGSGDDFSHAQIHDSGATTGEYRVRLPDGRLQVVKYTADSNGYKAKVLYHNGDSISHDQQSTTPAKVHQTTYPPQVDNNQVYFTPDSGYVPQVNGLQIFSNHQQNIFPEHHSGLIYLVENGRLTPIQI